MKRLQISCWLGTVVLSVTSMSAPPIELTATENAIIHEASSWNNGAGPAPTSADAIGLDFLVDGKQLLASNHAAVTTWANSLTLRNESDFQLRFISSGGTGGTRTFTIPGLLLDNSTMSTLAPAAGPTVNWRFQSPLTLTRDCILFRDSGATQNFTFNGAISGSGIWAIQGKIGYPMTVTIAEDGSYSGILSCENFGASSNTRTGVINLSANLGPLACLRIQSRTDLLTRTTTDEACVGGHWNVQVADGALTGTQRVELKRTGSTLTLNGNNAIGTLHAPAGTIQAATAAALTVTQSEDETIAAVLSGPLSLVKQGNSRMTLSGNNSLTGMLTAKTGALVIASPEALGSASALVADGGLLDIAAYRGALDVQTVSLLKGQMRICPAASTLRVAGELNVGSAELICDFTGVEEIGARYVLAAAATITGNVSNLSLSFIADDGLELTGELINDAGQLVLLIEGAQTELNWSVPSGVWSTREDDTPWTIRGSTEQVPFSDLALTVFGDVPEFSGPEVSVTVDGEPVSGGLFFNASVSDYRLEGSGTLSGTAELVKTGEKKVVIAVAYEATGAISIRGGEVALLQPPETLGMPIHLASGSILRLSSAAPLTLSGPLTGSGRIIKEGTGALTLTGNCDPDIQWENESSVAFVIPEGTSHTLNGPFSGSGDYIKAGAGNLTMMSAGYESQGVIRVAGGTLAFSMMDRGFNAFQFDPLKVRMTGDDSGGFSLSELQLMLGDTVVRWPENVQLSLQSPSTTNNGGMTGYANNQAGCCVDNSTSNELKWFDTRATSGKNPSVTSRNALTITFETPILADGYRIWGNGRQSRDPVSWIFQAGRKDAESTLWVSSNVISDAHLDSEGLQSPQAPMPPYANGAGFSVASAVFPIQTSTSSMQPTTHLRFEVEEGGALDLRTAAGDFGSLAGSGTLLLSGKLSFKDVSGFTGLVTGAGVFDVKADASQTVSFKAGETIELTASNALVTLTLADGDYWGTTISGNIRVAKVGAGEAILSSSQPCSYTGGTDVAGGTLEVGAVVARYFKFAITDVREQVYDNLPGHQFCKGVQLAEVQPMFNGAPVIDDGWNTQGSTLSNPNLLIDGTIASNSVSYSNNLKGSTNGSILIIDFKKMIPLDGYRWYTSHACPFRDPVGWRVEVSADKVNWIVLDERTRAENLVQPVEWIDPEHALQGLDAPGRLAEIGPFAFSGVGQVLPADGDVTIAEESTLLCRAPQSLASAEGKGTLVIPGLTPETTVGRLAIAFMRFAEWPDVEEGRVYDVMKVGESSNEPRLQNAASILWGVRINKNTGMLQMLYQKGLHIILY